MAKIVESPRNRNKRQAGFTVLIVCEGEKTERTYLKNYRRRDTGVRIEIPNTSNTDPLNLVRFASLKAEELGINKNTGSVWIVFDVDSNSDVLIEKVRKLAKRKNMEVILSNPSFELWYLIHFASTSTAPLTNTNLLSHLNRHIPGYNKALNYYDQLKLKQTAAITNAAILNKYHKDLGRDGYTRNCNPVTHVNKLVQYLNEITQ